MRSQAAHLAVLLLVVAATTFAADDSGIEKKESPLRFVPLLTSTPLTGTGVGEAASYLYKLDEKSSMSQLQVGGQYSDTDSITTFITNGAWLKDNYINSASRFLWSDINSEFDGDDGREVKYKIESLTLGQRFLFQVRKSIYLGAQAV